MVGSPGPPLGEMVPPTPLDLHASLLVSLALGLVLMWWWWDPAVGRRGRGGLPDHMESSGLLRRIGTVQNCFGHHSQSKYCTRPPPLFFFVFAFLWRFFCGDFAAIFPAAMVTDFFFGTLTLLILPPHVPTGPPSHGSRVRSIHRVRRPTLQVPGAAAAGVRQLRPHRDGRGPSEGQGHPLLAPELAQQPPSPAANREPARSLLSPLDPLVDP